MFTARVLQGSLPCLYHGIQGAVPAQAAFRFLALGELCKRASAQGFRKSFDIFWNLISITSPISVGPVLNCQLPATLYFRDTCHRRSPQPLTFHPFPRDGGMDHGSCSQVATALIPLSQALYANGDLEPARETCTRALKILQMAYGESPCVEVSTQAEGSVEQPYTLSFTLTAVYF